MDQPGPLNQPDSHPKNNFKPKEEISYNFLKKTIFQVLLKELITRPIKFLMVSPKINFSNMFERTNHLACPKISYNYQKKQFLLLTEKIIFYTCQEKLISYTCAKKLKCFILDVSEHRFAIFYITKHQSVFIYEDFHFSIFYIFFYNRLVFVFHL